SVAWEFTAGAIPKNEKKALPRILFTPTPYRKICERKVLLPSYFNCLSLWNVCCGARMLGPEQNASWPRVQVKSGKVGPIVSVIAGAGLKMLEPPTASAMALRNFVYPARMLCVYEPVLKSKPAACTGAWSTFANGEKVLGTKPATLRFWS